VGKVGGKRKVGGFGESGECLGWGGVWVLC